MDSIVLEDGISFPIEREVSIYFGKERVFYKLMDGIEDNDSVVAISAATLKVGFIEACALNDVDNIKIISKKTNTDLVSLEFSLYYLFMTISLLEYLYDKYKNLKDEESLDIWGDVDTLLLEFEEVAENIKKLYLSEYREEIIVDVFEKARLAYRYQDKYSISHLAKRLLSLSKYFDSSYFLNEYNLYKYNILLNKYLQTYLEKLFYIYLRKINEITSNFFGTVIPVSKLN